MSVIKICDCFLKTKLNNYDAAEYLKTKLIDYIVEIGEDSPFIIDDFIDEFLETNESFEAIDDSPEWDIEYSPEEVDEMVEEYFTSSEDELDEEEDDFIEDEDLPEDEE